MTTNVNLTGIHQSTFSTWEDFYLKFLIQLYFSGLYLQLFLEQLLTIVLLCFHYNLSEYG